MTRSILGEYERESFLKSTASLISRRDVTAVTSVTDNKIAAGEMVGVKVNRRLGPVTQSRDAFRKIGVAPDEFSFMLGQQSAPAMAIDYINVAVGAVRASIQNQGALLQYDATADTLKTLNHTAMVGAMSKFGDRSARITCFVGHSKPYFDLMKQQIADKLFEVAGATVYAGTIATFGKPFVVIDSPNLFLATTTNVYDVLGLVENAVEVAESEERDIISQPVTGLENLVDRIQGEYAFNLRVKGCAYDTGQGANPLDSVLLTPATWLKVVADNKELAGVRVSCN